MQADLHRTSMPLQSTDPSVTGFDRGLWCHTRDGEVQLQAPSGCNRKSMRLTWRQRSSVRSANAVAHSHGNPVGRTTGARRQLIKRIQHAGRPSKQRRSEPGRVVRMGVRPRDFVGSRKFRRGAAFRRDAHGKLLW